MSQMLKPEVHCFFSQFFFFLNDKLGREAIEKLKVKEASHLQRKIHFLDKDIYWRAIFRIFIFEEISRSSLPLVPMEAGFSSFKWFYNLTHISMRKQSQKW